MTQPTIGIPDQGPPGPPASAILGPGFSVPAQGAPAITITTGTNPITGAPSSFSGWAFPGMLLQFLSATGTSYGVLQVVGVPTPTTAQVQNIGLATAFTAVPAGTTIAVSGPTGPTGATGASGNPGWAAASNTFVLPAVGSTAVFDTTNTGFLEDNLYVSVSDGTNLATLLVQSVVPGVSATLLNPQSPLIAANPAPGTTFAIGAIMQATSAPGGPLGTQQVGSASFSALPIPLALVQPNAGTVVIWTMPLPAIAVGEVFRVEAEINYTSVSTSDFGSTVLLLIAKNMGGTIQTVTGGTTATDVSSPAYPLNTGPGSGLLTVANGGLQLSIVGNSSIEITANVSAVPGSVTGVQCYGVVSYSRLPGQSSGTATNVTAASASSGPGQGGTAVNLTVGSTVGVTAVAVLVGAVTVPASFSVVDNTHLNVVTGPLPPGSTPGAGTWVVTNAGGPSTGGPTFTYGDWPLAIFGNTTAFGIPSSIVETAGVVSQWSDVSGNGQHLTVGAVTGGTAETAPTFNANSSWQAGQGSISTDGVSKALSRAAFAIPANANVFLWVIGKIASTATVVAEYGTNPTFIMSLSVGEPVVYFLARQATYGSSVQNLVRSITAYADGAGQTNGSSTISVSNVSPVSTASTVSTTPANGPFVLGANTANAIYTQMEVVSWGLAWGFSTGGLTVSQLARFEAWAQTLGAA